MGVGDNPRNTGRDGSELRPARTRRRGNRWVWRTKRMRPIRKESAAADHCTKGLLTLGLLRMALLADFAFLSRFLAAFVFALLAGFHSGFAARLFVIDRPRHGSAGDKRQRTEERTDHGYLLHHHPILL